MKLTYALKHPDSRRVQRLVRRFGSYKRLLIAFSRKKRNLRSIIIEPLFIVRFFLNRGCRFSQPLEKFIIKAASTNSVQSLYFFTSIVIVKSKILFEVEFRKITARILLSANIITSPSHYLSALQWSCYNQLVNHTKLFLESGADPNNQGLHHKNPPLHLATDVKIINMLLNYGADINSFHEGRTALYGATFKKARILLEHGADPNLQENLWETPLHRAAKSGSREVIQLLISYGADITRTIEKSTATALKLAYLHRRYDVIDLLDG